MHINHKYTQFKWTQYKFKKLNKNDTIGNKPNRINSSLRLVDRFHYMKSTCRRSFGGVLKSKNGPGVGIKLNVNYVNMYDEQTSLTNVFNELIQIQWFANIIITITTKCNEGRNCSHLHHIAADMKDTSPIFRLGQNLNKQNYFWSNHI